MDVFLVTLALPLALPAMGLLALAVKLTSRGPVLFRHERVGRHGELFKVLKFRTMTPGTHESIWSDVTRVEEFAASGFKLADRDPAITKVGRLLRRTSLDELPQLFNVLGGSMSLVGVRPLVVPELMMRPEVDQILYTSMKPGITGLWQINGRSIVDIATRVELDRRYVYDWSNANDLRILAKTPVALLRVHHAA
jgi:lipopolysaccharide/colanic/teichoic acid biosynthesis glycosyltransferase